MSTCSWQPNPTDGTGDVWAGRRIISLQSIPQRGSNLAVSWLRLAAAVLLCLVGTNACASEHWALTAEERLRALQRQLEPLRKETGQLRDALAEAQQQNEWLRRENQGLRRLAAENQSASQREELAQLRQQVEALRGQLAQMQAENGQLTQQNQALREENQTLRRLAVEIQSRQGATNTVPATAPPAQAAGAADGGAVPNAAGMTFTHWLSTADGKRHSSDCRFFKTTAGRPCGPDEGGICSFCGD